VKEVIGDLWTYPADIRCFTTNGTLNSKGELVMGAGTALQAKKLWPSLPRFLGAEVQEFGNVPLFCGPPDNWMLTFPTKIHWKFKADLGLIQTSAAKLGWLSVPVPELIFLLPRPGCSNGGLLWSEVKPYLLHLPDNVLVISERN